MKHDPREGHFGVWWWAAIGALICLKLWLVAGQPIRVTWPAPDDDWLFLGAAEHLLRGEWLGPYNMLTLSKGLFLSFFIAASSLISVPLSIAKGLLYAAACLLMAVALRPLSPCRGLRFALFVVLLFNPITYSSNEYIRVLRQGLLPGLTLLMLSGLVALYARREQPLRRLWPWAMLLGLALPAFWLTREESIWMLPGLALPWLYLLWAIWRGAGGDRLARMGVVLVLPVLLWCLVTGMVAWMNWRHYGVFATCEMKHGSYQAAFGSLLRVKPQREIPFIPVPRETRERIYAVSPAFAELRPYLEGQLGEAYAANSFFYTRIPPAEREIAGGWFVWAVREAVELAGHGRTGADAKAFYERLAREVNDACDRGLLAAGRKRSGFMPPLRADQTRDVIDSMWAGMRFLCLFDGMKVAYEELSEGSPEVLVRFRNLTNERLKPLREGLGIAAADGRVDPVRVGALEVIHRGYTWVMPWTGAAAVIALGAAGLLTLRRRRLSYFLVLSLGCVFSLLALVGIVALIDATSYPTVKDSLYLTGGYGPWILCQFASFLALVELFGNKCWLAAGKTDAPPEVSASGPKEFSIVSENKAPGG